MFGRKKNKEAVPPAFAAAEAALKAKIEAIQKIQDPAEQLLQYKALQQATSGTYDLGKVRESKDTLIGNALGKGSFAGLKAGFGTVWAGAGIGAVALFGFSSVLGAGIAVGVGAVAAVGSTAFGYMAGRKKGLSVYNKYTPEEKHATRMSDLARSIDLAAGHIVRSYTSSDDRDLNLKALEKSAARERVLKEFPAITKAFNDYAAKKKPAAPDRAPLMKPPSSPPAAPK